METRKRQRRSGHDLEGPKQAAPARSPAVTATLPSSSCSTQETSLRHGEEGITMRKVGLLVLGSALGLGTAFAQTTTPASSPLTQDIKADRADIKQDQQTLQ